MLAWLLCINKRHLSLTFFMYKWNIILSIRRHWEMKINGRVLIEQGTEQRETIVFIVRR